MTPLVCGLGIGRTTVQGVGAPEPGSQVWGAGEAD